MTEKDYSAVPLWHKLGIKEGSAVKIVGGPKEFAAQLGAPASARFGGRAPFDVTLIFATDAIPLERDFDAAIGRITLAGGLWVAWPKKTSKIPNQLDFDVVQHIGLDRGLVDNKICRIDDDWQAMRFVRRKADR